MRMNTPVTDIEYSLSDNQTIVSTTDRQGNITYVNPYFVEVSGFTEQELIGSPQNILRHPDMPVEAYADMWATIQSGLSWTGMVKNRCKNGDFYWVFANVTPVMENGRETGYMSVRTKPTRQQINDASVLYRNLKNGNPDRIALSQGAVVSTGVMARLGRMASLSLGQRISLNLGFALLALALLAAMNITVSGPSWLTVLALLAIACVAYLWFSLYQGVIAPVRQALLASRIMAGGDLTQDISTTRKDDVGQLLRSLRQLRVNLHSVVGDVRSNFEQIGQATGEIAAGNMDLSGRTESQASALEETASSMEELASTVQQNTGNATQANTMAGEAAAVAGKGGAIVAQVVTTMGDITTSSKRIVDIISLIEGIAFQTNILALNAAVEAARAGEQGRGFAVVASEVRNLAQRSASAAKEIKQLIDVSVERIGSGTALAEQAGNTMRDIIASVDRVSSIMNEIALASHEQNAGIGQVNDAVTQMDEVTQQNAALVEQAAAAAGSLQEQTLKVMQTLTVFKLTHQHDAVNALAAVPFERPVVRPRLQKKPAMPALSR
ncbi:methyl-accepting chemotaxis protein [Actimicrobium sp. CCI2.3]|uniref:methyl-accepting chemotaxis protein n=1 Tax=Actimicrobium sp. CCI2.3 TaxID=3048616 RepID=UPI002AB485BA|nr:methyl-accepting chemotaxis protein [Actimicrobium sp. CCI2.3]MDY7575481.1 methyl-accepting chemotaxis protein [Actimicrobium sp. CCI2.3]MEB0024030.1 methyl-accepting chemotaxis protein [Actimicrobium sp. CCI2.3]